MGIWSRLLARKARTAPAGNPAAETVEPARFLPVERTDCPFRDLSSDEVAQQVSEGAQVLDVRFEHEYERRHIPGAKLLPLPILYQRYAELDPGQTYVVVCEHGIRSYNACHFLAEKGFTRLFNLSGGMSAYTGPQAAGQAQ
ncbi:MAG: rhodanese-like domain-containing protein [Acidobacteriota bacterium]